MKILGRLSDTQNAREVRGCVVAVGTFDGVHIGHRDLLSRAVSLAQDMGVPCVVFTFQNHPLSVLAPDRVPPSLSAPGERRRVFASLGVDLAIEEPFTKELAALPAEGFLARLVEVLAPRAVVVGENFSFGAGGRGTPDFLAAQGEKRGFCVEKCRCFPMRGKRCRARGFVRCSRLATCALRANFWDGFFRSRAS